MLWILWDALDILIKDVTSFIQATSWFYFFSFKLHPDSTSFYSSFSNSYDNCRSQSPEIASSPREEKKTAQWNCWKTALWSCLKTAQWNCWKTAQWNLSENCTVKSLENCTVKSSENGTVESLDVMKWNKMYFFMVSVIFSRFWQRNFTLLLYGFRKKKWQSRLSVFSVFSVY